MIPDQIFKSLNHNFKGFSMHLNGQEIEPGYKPDFVLKKGNKYIILESESTSSRKTYVGGLIKAAHFLQNERKGLLIFVINPKENTRIVSIAKHLKPYLNWIKEKTNLKEVFVIDEAQYYCDNAVLALDCDKFKTISLRV